MEGPGDCEIWRYGDRDEDGGEVKRWGVRTGLEIDLSEEKSNPEVKFSLLEYINLFRESIILIIAVALIHPIHNKLPQKTRRTKPQSTYS